MLNENVIKLLNLPKCVVVKDNLIDIGGNKNSNILTNTVILEGL